MRTQGDAFGVTLLEAAVISGAGARVLQREWVEDLHEERTECWQCSKYEDEPVLRIAPYDKRSNGV